MAYTGEKLVQYMKSYNQLNRKALTLKKAERRAAQREYIQDQKSKPCTDCGVTYPTWVMEFDHVRGVKRHNLSHLARATVSWKTIKDEIAKCEVVCSNCHAQRTHDREIGVSFNGRTAASKTANVGSTPATSAATNAL